MKPYGKFQTTKKNTVITYDVVTLMLTASQVIENFFLLQLHRTQLTQVTTRRWISIHALALNNSLQTCDKHAHATFYTMNLKERIFLTIVVN